MQCARHTQTLNTIATANAVSKRMHTHPAQTQIAQKRIYQNECPALCPPPKRPSVISLHLFLPISSLLLLHELMRLARIARVHERHEHRAQLLEIHRLRDIAVETRVDALLVDVTEDVGRKRDDGQVLELVLLLPAT